MVRIKEGVPGWDESTPSEVKEEPGEFTYRPELADVNRTSGRPDETLEELPKQGTEMEDVNRTRELPEEVPRQGKELPKTKEEALGWDKFTPSKIKKESVEFTSGPELENRMAAEMIKEEAPEQDEVTPREVKEELQKQGTALEDVNRARELSDEAKEEAPGWD